MPDLIRTYPILQSEIEICRLDGSTVTRESDPSGLTFTKVGMVPEASLSVEIERKERKYPVKGQLHKAYKDIGRAFMLKMKVEEANKLLIDLVVRSDDVSGEAVAADQDAFTSHGTEETMAFVRLKGYSDEDDVTEQILIQGLAYIQLDGDLTLGGEEWFNVPLKADFEGSISGKYSAAYAQS